MRVTSVCPSHLYSTSGAMGGRGFKMRGVPQVHSGIEQWPGVINKSRCFRCFDLVSAIVNVLQTPVDACEINESNEINFLGCGNRSTVSKLSPPPPPSLHPPYLLLFLFS